MHLVRKKKELKDGFFSAFMGNDLLPLHQVATTGNPFWERSRFGSTIFFVVVSNEGCKQCTLRFAFQEVIGCVCEG